MKGVACEEQGGQCCSRGWLGGRPGTCLEWPSQHGQVGPEPSRNRSPSPSQLQASTLDQVAFSQAQAQAQAFLTSLTCHHHILTLHRLLCPVTCWPHAGLCSAQLLCLTALGKVAHPLHLPLSTVPRCTAPWVGMGLVVFSHGVETQDLVLQVINIC